jgi:hypothetical protein
MSSVSEPRKKAAKPAHWWRRRGWSMLVLLLLLGGIVAVGARMALRVSDALPEVGKDARGDDPWNDPIGVERVGAFAVAHIPDCAAGPVVRIALWNEQSGSYWEVSGPPTPITSFVVGVTPEGFKEETPFHSPPRNAILRLVVFRSVKGPAGVRYEVSDLRKARVVSMLPLSRFTIEGFQTADVCGKKAKSKKRTPTTTDPGQTLPTDPGQTLPSQTVPTTGG